MIHAGVGFTAANITFNWIASDVGAGSTPANFKVAKSNSSNWILNTVASPLSTSIQATGVTAFGDFQTKAELYLHGKTYFTKQFIL